MLEGLNLRIHKKAKDYDEASRVYYIHVLKSSIDFFAYLV